MKRKLSFLFLSALTIPFFMGSCSDDKEEQEVKPATDLVVDYFVIEGVAPRGSGPSCCLRHRHDGAL